MITIVMFDQFESIVSESESAVADAIVDSDILVITEDSQKAFSRIISHMEDNPDDEFEYQIQFWLAEEVIGTSVIGSDVTIEEFNERKNDILALVRQSLH